MPVVICPSCATAFRLEGLPASEEAAAARLEERRQVVAFLRVWGRNHGAGLADAIERGEHVEAES